jgi:hypothetical protein
MRNDLLSSARTLLDTKITAQLCGITSWTLSYLASCGLPSSPEAYPFKGFGFGTSGDRKAGVDPAVAEARERIWKEMIRINGNDTTKARAFLERITSGKITDYTQLTSEAWVDRATEKMMETEEWTAATAPAKAKIADQDQEP